MTTPASRDKRPLRTAELHGYVLDHNPPLDPVLRDLVQTTRARFPDRAGPGRGRPRNRGRCQPSWYG